jgi:hypothetical protein
MLKKIFATFLSIVFLFPIFISSVYSQSPSPTPSSSEVNSFEVFWPLSAGKVEGERFYGLKILKENARGALIFGKPQKAEYKMFLATKRFLEVEKLIKEKKEDKAKITLINANRQLTETNNILTGLKGKNMPTTANEINKKIDNLQLFIPYLEKSADGTLKDELSKSSQLLEDVSKNI